MIAQQYGSGASGQTGYPQASSATRGTNSPVEGTHSPSPSVPTASSACIACRRRKVKCILAPNQSICVTCTETGSECTFAEGKKRGPQKGYFDVISKRLGRMEELLAKVVGGGEIAPGMQALLDAVEENEENNGAESDEEDDEVEESPLPDVWKIEVEDGSDGLSAAVAWRSWRDHPRLGALERLTNDTWMDRSVDAAKTRRHEELYVHPQLANDLIETYFERYNAALPLLSRSTFMNAHRNPHYEPIPPWLYAAIFQAARTVHPVSDPDRIRIRRAVAEIPYEPRLSCVQAFVLTAEFSVPNDSNIARDLALMAAIRLAVDMGIHRRLPEAEPLSKGVGIASGLTWTRIFTLEIWRCARTGAPSMLPADFEMDLPELPKSSNYAFLSALMRVSKMLSRVLRVLYYPGQQRRFGPREAAQLRRVRRKLDDWYQNLPSHLLPEEDSPAEASWKADVLLVACHSVTIWMHRPFGFLPALNRSRSIIEGAIGRCTSNPYVPTAGVVQHILIAGAEAALGATGRSDNGKLESFLGVNPAHVPVVTNTNVNVGSTEYYMPSNGRQFTPSAITSTESSWGGPVSTAGSDKHPATSIGSEYHGGWRSGWQPSPYQEQAAVNGPRTPVSQLEGRAYGGPQAPYPPYRHE